MVTLFMNTWSVTPLTSSNKTRRVNRYSGMAFASIGTTKENPCLGVKVGEGQGNLPKVSLTSSGGSEAELYLFGGCVTSWKVANKDLLFVRPDAVFNGQKPISGGIPHCFPQFGPGQIQQHGFARNMNWSIVSSENVEGNPTITLELKDGPYSLSMWDYAFQALYKVTLDKKALSTELKITNTDQKPFSFTTALHTYFSAVAASSILWNSCTEAFFYTANIIEVCLLRASVTGAAVKGLKDCETLNKDSDPKNPIKGQEERDVVTFLGFVDCVYLDAPSELHLDNGLGDTISIKNTNWSDAVLWNPYLTMEASYKYFVCVKNAKIGLVNLVLQQSWTEVQNLSVA